MAGPIPGRLSRASNPHPRRCAWLAFRTRRSAVVARRGHATTECIPAGAAAKFLLTRIALRAGPANLRLGGALCEFRLAFRPQPGCVAGSISRHAKGISLERLQIRGAD